MSILVLPPTKPLKGKRFEGIDTIKQNATSTLKTIPKDSQKTFPALAGPLDAVCQVTWSVF
jgi:hypothetical protein